MRIQTYVNFKLRSGKVMVAGTYDDSQKPFPDEIYEEIEKNRSVQDRSRWTLRIIEESAAPSSPDSNLMDTMDTQANVIDTQQKPKKRKRKK